MALFLGLVGSLPALTTNDGYTQEQTKVAPDSEAGGWFINLGITGARARMSPERPKEIEVAYVFKRSPAKGKFFVSANCDNETLAMLVNIVSMRPG